MILNKIRILHIIPNFGSGGAERLVIDLMESTNKKLFEVSAVSLYPESGTHLEKEIREKGLNVFFLNKNLGPDLRIPFQLYSLFSKLRPHVIHSHRYVLRYVLLPMIFCSIPVCVHTVHNIAQKEVDLIGKIIHLIAFRLCGVVPVSISQEISRTIHAVYGHNIYTPVIYNGISTKRYISLSSGNNEKQNKEFTLLHIGRFAPQKNHNLLIKAFALIIKEYPAIKLWLVGDGPLRSDIQELVKKKGLEGKVSFLGIRDDVPKLLIKSDILVLSSDWEGLPITILEAMSVGTPVVATAVGGVSELVVNGETGVLVPPGDPHALAHAILRIIKDSSFRFKIGEAGKKRVIDRFDITQIAKEYEELYLKLLEERLHI